ncbi:MAG: class I SAM-dependent methyltransferase [Planctomycetota bacterium]
MPAELEPHVVDVGSGVTFFPFTVAQLSCRVTCTDVAAVCEKDLVRAAQVLRLRPMDFRHTDGIKLPFADEEADAIYCISVVEHIAHFEHTVTEMARILKPSGMLVLTFDFDLRGDLELSVKQYQHLMAVLDLYFIPAQPDRTIHPADMLRSNTGPYASLQTRNELMFWLKQHVKALLGRKLAPPFPGFFLAVGGMALRRRKVRAT